MQFLKDAPRTLCDSFISQVKKLSPREVKYVVQICTTQKELKLGITHLPKCKVLILL